MKEMYWVSENQNVAPSRKNRTKTTDLAKAWKTFPWWTNIGVGNPGMYLKSRNSGVLAYSFQREGFPSGDLFDRMRIRVTGAMPLEFKLKLIEEVKAGKRHMRQF